MVELTTRLTIMTISLIIITISLVQITYAAYWVQDPLNCPQTHGDYPGQNCAPEEICGDFDCYEASSISPPGGHGTSNTNYDGGQDGGYVINCFADDGSAPDCDNSGAFWCDRNSTCYTTQKRDTNCTGGSWAVSTCGDCRSSYFDCNDDGVNCEVQTGTSCGVDNQGEYDDCDCSCYPTSNYLDCNNTNATTGDGCETQYHGACGTQAWYTGCSGGSAICTCKSNYYYCDAAPDDGDGCEVNDGGACTAGSLTGVWDCNTGAGSCYTVSGGTEYICTCVTNKYPYWTGNKTSYSTAINESMIWGVDWGTGPLVNITKNTSTEYIHVDRYGNLTVTGSITDGFGTTLDQCYVYTNLQSWGYNQTYIDALTDWGYTEASVWGYNQTEITDLVAAVEQWNYTDAEVWGYNQSEIDAAYFNYGELEAWAYNQTDSDGLYYTYTELQSWGYNQTTIDTIDTNITSGGNITGDIMIHSGDLTLNVSTSILTKNITYDPYSTGIKCCYTDGNDVSGCYSPCNL